MESILILLSIFKDRGRGNERIRIALETYERK